MTGAVELPDAYTAGIGDLDRAALAPGRLPDAVKQLAISLTFANKGNATMARRHGEAALAGGLTRPQVVEALLAATLSRGTWVLEDQRWLVDAAPEGEWSVEASPVPSADEIGAYFARTFGNVPGWLATLVDLSPATLETYYGLRAEILRDGALPRAHKELLLVVINASERYDVGLETHLRGALDGGAERADLYEAIRAAIVPGGMVAWIAGAQAAERVLKPEEQDHA